jgi:uncharacterized OB-fold protein
MEAKKQIPCLEGWITMPPEEPRLIGNRCGSCGNYFFPKVTTCRNPLCPKTKPLEKVLLSRKGKLFAYTINYYSPPPPYHAPDPFVPFGVASVEMPEGIKVGGQIPRSVDLSTLKIGMEMEVVREVLYTNKEGNEVLCWMFQPATS